VIEEEKNEETTADDAAAPAPEDVADQEAVNEEIASDAEVQPSGGDAPAEEPAAPPAEPEEPAEELGPKERRRRRRSAHTGEAAAQRTPEERAAERAESRRKKAAERRRWRQRSRARRREQPKTEPLARGEHGPGAPRVRQGVVVSDRADKTITVRIDVTRRHRVYKKIVRSSSTLHAHDERNEANAGDTVRIVESRPLSRTKRWRLVEVVERAR
jgi:small subunit ribosomal protein S17